MSAETICLTALVHNQDFLPHDLSLEEAERYFRDREVAYAALVRDGRVMGLCDRRRVVSLLGTRFGFSLNSRHPAHQAQVDFPLVYEQGTPIRLVLQEAMARVGGAFLEDIIVVDSQHRLLGLVSTETLAKVQNALVSEQVAEISRQNEELKAFDQRMKAREKQVLFDTLVAGIAHELNNKITPVIGFSELLQEAVQDEASKTFLDCIRKSTSEAAAIIRQLLQLSRPETGTRSEVDLREIVSEALLMLKFHMQQGNLRVSADVCQEPVPVFADAAMVKQVIMNLAINAIHASEGQEEPRIQFIVRRLDGEGGAITVKDNGTGIPKSLLGRIFDPFFTTKAPDKGTGLGLSVCLSIARQHGGTLCVESEPGHGAAFTLSLPRGGRESGLTPQSVPTVFALPAPLQLPQDPSSERIRILVVDDEETVRQLMREVLLRGIHCKVDIAANADSALAMTRRTDFDLVVSDVRMPGMNGVDFYREVLRSSPHYQGRFLLTTGYAGNGEVEQEIHHLGLAVLRKPFTAEILLQACSERLQKAMKAA